MTVFALKKLQGCFGQRETNPQNEFARILSPLPMNESFHLLQGGILVLATQHLNLNYGTIRS